MIKIRHSIFETNSSSTHSLSYFNNNNHYLNISSKILIRFIHTDEETILTTLKDKVSYLVSHIINEYKYNVDDYDDLKEQVEKDYNFQKIKRYVSEHFGKEIVLPKKYKGDIEEIVDINHQLVGDSIEDVLKEIVTYDHDLLDDVLSKDSTIAFGRD